MITAVYSDPHFGHENIIKYAERPFRDAREMNAVLIERYNERIGPKDVVLWLGDCFLMPYTDAYHIMRRLNGHKILIPGNHDRSVKAMLTVGFSMVVPEVTMMLGDRKCRFHHYPYSSSRVDDVTESKGRPVRSSEKGVILVHGHTHSVVRKHDDMVHVGVDAWDYAPVGVGELTELIRRPM